MAEFLTDPLRIYRPLTVGDLTRQLRLKFGFPGFRPGQEEVIRAVLARRDALAVMPTGQGKSLCYRPLSYRD